MDALLQDVRYALRALRRAPAFTAVAVVTLAIGMGASTAIFALLKRVVLDPLPYPESARLVRLTSAVPGVSQDGEWQLSSAQLFFFRNEAKSFETVAGYRRSLLNLELAGEPRRAHVAVATAEMLPLVGARVVAGRLFGSADDRPDAPFVALLSNGLWHSRFGADPSVIGRVMSLDGQPYEIVGVLAAGVELPGARGEPVSQPSDLWVPMRLNPAGPFYNSHVIPAVARLAPGARPEDAQQELDRLTALLPGKYPTAYRAEFLRNARFRTTVYPLKAYVLGDIARNLWILFAAVGLVMLIAAANVANLLLVRQEARHHETAVRAALGAGSTALARATFAEALLLALAGSLLGVWLCDAGLRLLASLAPTVLPGITEADTTPATPGFAGMLAVVVACGLGMAVSVRATPGLGSGALGEGGRGATAGAERRRVRNLLVSIQVALAVVLIAGAGLLLQSFRRLRGVAPGVSPDGVVVMQVGLPHRYDDAARQLGLYRDLLERVRSLPGVRAAGASGALPFMDTYGCTTQGFVPGEMSRLAESGIDTCAGMASATPGYFEALGIPLRSGRLLFPEDNEHPEAGSVVVSEAFARRFWAGRDPIGQLVQPYNTRAPKWYRVVGVVGDVYPSALTDKPALAIYYPVVGIPGQPGPDSDNRFLVVRTSLADPLSVVPGIRRALHDLDPSIPLADVELINSIIARSMSRLTFTMTLLGVAAGAALLLAALGLYGVVSYLITRRRAEIGVRMALGAGAGTVERMVVGESMKLAATGGIAGIVASLTVARVLGSLLYGVRPTDVASHLAAVAILGAVAAVAAWIPARRAARLDPVAALRGE